MRRNISNELIVALLAAVSLVFAAVFAVLLSTSTSPRPPIPAPAETATSSPTAVMAMTIDATETRIPADVSGTPTEDEAPFASRMTLTGMASTVVATQPLAQQTDTAYPPASETLDVSASASPEPTEAIATATIDEAATRIAPANLTLTAIRETVVAFRERSTATAGVTAIEAMETPRATIPTSLDGTQSTTPSATEAIATATSDAAATGIATANLTLTAIRETVVAVGERSTATAGVTAIEATETPRATVPMPLDGTQSATPTPPEVVATAWLDAAATGIAPANLTLNVIRETVVAVGERSTATAGVTAIEATETPRALVAATLDGTQSATPLPPEVVATARLDAAATGIAPANLTLTAIREIVVAFGERSTATAGVTAIEATETPRATVMAPLDGTQSATPLPTEAIATATIDEAATRIAPANLTLTAIRETVVAFGDRATATAGVTAIEATKTPRASVAATLDGTQSATPTPPEVVATAASDAAATGIAPANLTLTAIRETVVAFRERSTATAEATAFEATEMPPATMIAPLDGTQSATPLPPEVIATATLDAAATGIAPANLTLTAIREMMVAFRERSTATAGVTAIEATKTPRATVLAPLDGIQSATPSVTEATATATSDAATTSIAPANLTLTAIHETVVAFGIQETEQVEATAGVTAIEATETPRALVAATLDGIQSATPLPPEVVATATLDAAATGIAPANLTLTAIRETVVAFRERSTATAGVTAIEATETQRATVLAPLDGTQSATPLPPEVVAIAASDAATTSIAPLDGTQSATPLPTEVVATATIDAAATGIAPANLTLTAIREMVVAFRERATATAGVTAIEAMETPRATVLAPLDGTLSATPTPSEADATAASDTAATGIAPANLTLTAIRETVAAFGIRATATAGVTAIEATETQRATMIAPLDGTQSATPTPPEVVATAASDAAATRIAPANRTLTAIREIVVAFRERSTAKAEATAFESTETPRATVPTPLDGTESATPLPPEAIATATIDEAATGIAPANLTLTAIREMVVAFRERATAPAKATAGVTAIEATMTPRATVMAPLDGTQSATPLPTEVVATATLDAAATGIAPLDGTQSATPTPTEADATDTIVEAATGIAPANLTLTAIREMVVAFGIQATERVKATAGVRGVDATETQRATVPAPLDGTQSATPQPTEADATATLDAATTSIAPLDGTQSATPLPTEVVATATIDAAATGIAPANLTLTAIRETVVAFGDRATATAGVTAIEATKTPRASVAATLDGTQSATPTPPEVVATAAIDAAATSIAPLDGIQSATPLPTEVVATATLDAAATGIAPANLTLTAIREIVVAFGERSTATAGVTAIEATETSRATVIAPLDGTQSATPLPTEVIATATLDAAATRIAPANLTLTAIRETVVAFGERSTAPAEATAGVTAIEATETSRATVIAPLDGTQSATPLPTEAIATATIDEAATGIAPANLTLTAIREMVVAFGIQATERVKATAGVRGVDATETQRATVLAPLDGTQSATPTPSEADATATIDAAATGIAPLDGTQSATPTPPEVVATATSDAAATGIAPLDGTQSATPLPTEVVATDTIVEAATSIAPLDGTESATPLPTEAIATATIDEAATGIAPANLTLTAIRETVVAFRERSTATAGVTAIESTETPRATVPTPLDGTESATPLPPEAIATATIDEAATGIAPANLTLTAIREMVVAFRERATAPAKATAGVTAIEATMTPRATVMAPLDGTQSATPLPTEVVATAALDAAATGIAPTNLTLNVIRETVVAVGERSTATAGVTAIEATKTPRATVPAPLDGTQSATPLPTEVVATAASDAAATGIAPANLTLNVIRETVVAVGERSTATAGVTAIEATKTPRATVPTPLDGTQSATLTPPEVVATATSDAATTGIAPANLTLTAIRETVVAFRERSTATAGVTAIEATETPRATVLAPLDGTQSATPSATEADATATLDAAATGIAPANLTLTAIREIVVAFRERSTATAEVTAIEATETPRATVLAPLDGTQSATLTPPEVVATATSDAATTGIAPANLTLTAIRETVVAFRERSTATAGVTAIEATETPRATVLAPLDGTQSATPSATEADATATLDAAATGIAPANLTLTAIREIVVAFRERSTATAEVTAIEATETPRATVLAPLDGTQSATLTPPEVVATATSDAATTGIAPANLTLTAIRETVVAFRERSTATAGVTAIEATETPRATVLAPLDGTQSATPSATEADATATLDAAATGIAPANLTLTAIREIVVAFRERSTATAGVTAIEATETQRATVTAPLDGIQSATPLPTEAIATATSDAAATPIAPANLTLTAIREMVVAFRERSTAKAGVTAIEATESPSATVTIPMDDPESATPLPTEVVATATSDAAATGIAPLDGTESATPLPTEAIATATSDAAATGIAPANLTLTAIREMMVAFRERSTAKAGVTAIEATKTPPATMIAPLDRTQSATPLPTEVVATATLDAAATGIAPLDGTLSATPLPTEVVATAASDAAATSIAPANRTLTAIRETVVAFGIQATERVEATAGVTAIEATETPPATMIATTELVEFVTPPPTDSAVGDIATPEAQIAVAATSSATASPRGTDSRKLTITPTVTPLPFYFAHLIATPTAFGSIAEPQPPDCEVEQSWRTYEVQAGDTLLSLAIATGSSLIELRGGNCMAPIRGIFAGERLRVPRLPVEPIARPAPVFPADDDAVETAGCDQPGAQIVMPKPLAQVDGVFAIRGTALIPERGSYHIALKPGWADDYHPYLQSDRNIRLDVLGLVNTEIFGAGLHRIRLVVTDGDGEAIEGGLCDLPVVFGAP